MIISTTSDKSYYKKIYHCDSITGNIYLKGVYFTDKNEIYLTYLLLDYSFYQDIFLHSIF
jgi:hypothetical protein